ncbi:MAG: glycosyltransferase family 2 protein, partial [Acidobacteriota bacterium]|nr:glycosyltransferase family 2 protein [Acidobacteriota bacterium]
MSTTPTEFPTAQSNPAEGTGVRPKPLGDPWYWLVYGGILTGIVLLIHAHMHGVFLAPLANAAESHHWVRVFIFPSMLWITMGTLLLIFRTALWMAYRPFPHATSDTAPPLTVIIPAYNEGPMVLKSIESVVRAHYPLDRMEIYVVDDGSRDDTWTYIEQAAAKWPDLVHAIRFPKNQGKRAALAAGFEAAKGEIVVTIDSDSALEPDALLAIAGPFRNPKVGAVAGKVGAYNRDAGWLPRMLHVRYILSFDVLRAVESSYGTVYCCPGALTAYRTSIVRQVLPDWMKQKFLGAQCTFGEDRALTNWILSLGYSTVYQRTAAVATIVPTQYKQLCKMFLRWDRSYVREELRFMKIVWKRPPVYASVALWDRLVTNLHYPVSYFSLAMLVLLAQENPFVLVRFLLAVAVASFFYALYYLRTERSFHFLYGIVFSYFDLLLLSWIFPYAVFT